MKRSIKFLQVLWRSITSLLDQSSKTFIAPTEQEQLDYHTISISTR